MDIDGVVKKWFTSSVMGRHVQNFFLKNYISLLLMINQHWISMLCHIKQATSLLDIDDAPIHSCSQVMCIWGLRRNDTARMLVCGSWCLHTLLKRIRYFSFMQVCGMYSFLFLKIFIIFCEEIGTNKNAIWIKHIHGHLASPAVVDRAMLWITGATELWN